MRVRTKEAQTTGPQCHLCKTFRGDIAIALDQMVNRRRLFSSYSDAAGQAILAYYHRVLEDDLKLSRLRALSSETGEEG
jgi:hypothetical protein